MAFTVRVNGKTYSINVDGDTPLLSAFVAIRSAMEQQRSGTWPNFPLIKSLGLAAFARERVGYALTRHAICRRAPTGPAAHH